MPQTSPGLFASIEAGGTKFICGIGTCPDDLETIRIPTTSPEATVEQAVSWLREKAVSRLLACGIGSFGPLDLDPASPAFGQIAGTPKKEWRHYNLHAAVQNALQIPVALDTDVNAALLAEIRWGAARHAPSCIYMTVGTGIGAGAAVSGTLLYGVSHPEMGHLRIPHDLAADPFPGVCPFHQDCLEGLASGPAIEARWGMPASQLPSDHPAWRLESDYLALGLANLAVTLSPARILMGGGVMQQPRLMPLVERRLTELLNGYVHVPRILPPELGTRAGILGALALAQSLAQNNRRAPAH